MDDKTRQLVKEDTLCSNNLLVKHYLNTLKKKLKKLGVTDEEVFELINDGLEVLRVMKKSGQSLENRLRLLKTHIEACGFVRVRKGKTKKWQQ